MTEADFADRLRATKPGGGPNPDAVAFRAGTLAATRRARPTFALLAITAAAGWGVAGYLALPDPPEPVALPIVAPPPPPPPDDIMPTPWRERSELIDRLSANGLDALGPPRPPAFPLRFLDPDPGDRS